jgi:hypothetical protein
MSTPDPEPNNTNKRRSRDRHGRRDRQTATGSDQTRPRARSDATRPPRLLGAPRVVSMTADEYERAVRAWTALIGTWWTEQPPEN